MMVNFLCPVCKAELVGEGHSLKCANNHCYDIAKSGYVNLLPSSGVGKRHGDDKLMVKARADFLNKGYYDTLADSIAEICSALSSSDPVIVDAGCGEGMYTEKILNRVLSDGKLPDVIGLDISKDALLFASRRCKAYRTAVASTADIPLPASCADIVVNIFSPFMKEEFIRILKPAGKIIRVVPMERHLFELKAFVYDNPYLNPPVCPEEAGLRVVSVKEIKYSICAETNDDVKALFMMTPYYYKTSSSDQKKLDNAKQLDINLEFEIIVYEKDG